MLIQGICNLLIANCEKTRPDTRHKSFAVFVSARQKKRLPTDQRTDGPTDGPTDRRTDGRTDGRTDTPSYRDERTHLKKVNHLPNIGPHKKILPKFLWSLKIQKRFPKFAKNEVLILEYFTSHWERKNCLALPNVPKVKERIEDLVPQ